MLMKSETVITKTITHLPSRKNSFTVILPYKCGRGTREHPDISWLSIKSWRLVLNFTICKTVTCTL